MSYQTLVGIAQMKVSRDPEEVLVAPNLGSCLGLTVYDPINKQGGVIHCLLPLSKSDLDKSKATPTMYVDTGVSLLLNTIVSRGSDPKKLVITAGGCGNINDENNVFQIGKKNYTILKKLLWKNNLLLSAENIGDSFSRTISLEIGTGKSSVKIQGQTFELK